MDPIHFDHHTLAPLISASGFYDDFTCPDHALVYGTSNWHEDINQWDPDLMYHNMWLVHNKDAQQFLDLVHHALQEAIPETDALTNDPIAMVSTWQHPSASYCLVGSFTNIGLIGVVQGEANLLDQWPIVWDLQYNDLENIMSRMAEMEPRHHLDACLLLQRLAVPEGVAQKIKKRSQQRDPIQWPIDDMLVLRYFQKLFDQGRDVNPTLSTMLERHDLVQGIGDVHVDHKDRHKKKM